MGSEVELDQLNDDDVENTVFIAVGKDVKESKSVILWAVDSFSGMKFCLLHIHQPPQLVTLLVDRVSTSRLKQQVVKACRELEQRKMQTILKQYSLILSECGVQAAKVWIEADNVEKGIMQTITQHGIQLLVMGAAADNLYSKDMSELKSNKAIYVCQQAPISCQIWFACKGHLIYKRGRAASPNSHIRSTTSLSSSGAGEETMFSSPHESQEQLVQSLSAMLLDGHTELSSAELQDKLEFATTDAENSKQKAFEESIKRWKAEEDAKEALHKAEASEKSLTEEIMQRKETEATLAAKSQEIRRMKNQRDRFIKELQMVKDQNPQLVDRISKARETEKELEDRIIQAVNLLITFKEKRDSLQNERDNARIHINRLAKYVNEEKTNLSHARFYKPSFLEIMEATQDFNQSLKIGEGKRGSVYKGILRHVRVAIKMLPSLGSQSDAEFELEAEVLSRIRHPNLVTLIGVCSESRSLIYEYLENGSLEDRIASLPWHSRIKIASEICSALIFLHGSNPQIIHGNLNLSNILLDSNNISKLSDLGITRNFFSKDQTFFDLLYNNNESGELSVSSDIYSFGVVLLRILSGRPASSIVNVTLCALENGNFGTVLDLAGGDWPIEHAKELAVLGLRCCEKNPTYRPNLLDDILQKLEIMKNLFITSPVESENHRRIPSYFVCPIFQEVMKDPYIAADGFTYEEDAIKGWINSGHKTSPMTNLKLDHCDLLPNHALSFAIQEWQQLS